MYVDEYVESFKPTLIDVVFKWSHGGTFDEICKATDIFEGSIIRALRRLDELLNNLEKAAAAVGDVRLANSFKESRDSIRRGLPFAASLYV